MLFWKRKEQRPLEDSAPGEFWLMPGEFRAEDALPGMVGLYGLPNGYRALGITSEREAAPFHTIVQYTVEQVSVGYPVALTVTDCTGDVCAREEAYLLELRQMALDQCVWSLEQTASTRKEYLFVFDQVPPKLYEALYRYVNVEHFHEDVYLNCSVLRKGTLHCFDTASAMEQAALLNLYVDWGHLVLIMQAAPDYPMEKLTAALTDSCKQANWIFSDRTKE
jgi:hypothetical protein